MRLGKGRMAMLIKLNSIVSGVTPTKYSSDRMDVIATVGDQFNGPTFVRNQSTACDKSRNT